MQLNYVEMGNGPSLVLLHGLLGNAQNLASTAKHLADYFHVINIDLRNHGASAHSPQHDYNTMAYDVIETLDKLNISQASILGHSMGGKVAMNIALTHPNRVNKLIVEDIAPVTYPARHQAIFIGLQAINLAQLANRQAADKVLSEYVEELSIRRFLLANLIKNEDGWAWKMNLAALFAQYHHICQFPQHNDKQFTGDTLFIKGANSDYILAAHKQAINNLFPNAKAKIIEGAGHWIHAEKSTIFNKVVLDFLQK